MSGRPKCSSALSRGMPCVRAITVSLALVATRASSGCAQAAPASAWDSVGRILKAPATFNGGYYRYGFPRRDITLRVGDVTVAPSLALGSWAGFSGELSRALLMGDLVLLSGELRPVLEELSRQKLAVTAIHNHLSGEAPPIIYVHFHGEGDAREMARRLDVVIGRTATPRPVSAATPAPVTIDTTVIFATLGIRGRAQGAVALMSTVLVPGNVRMHGRFVNAAMAYGTPINIQMVDTTRAVSTGDFTVRGTKVDGVVHALTTNGITTTAVHSHLIDEQPSLRYIHYWADGPLPEVLRGLKAALDAAR